MGKSLVVVESPAKAKTINKILGNDFVVKYDFNGLTGYLVQHDDTPVGDLGNLLAG